MKLRRQSETPIVTYALIGISVFVFIITGFGQNWQKVVPFLLTTPFQGGFLPEVSQGQLWRLITPIFIHFGWIHIVFNLYWLWQLGGLIELRFGPVFIGILVILLGMAGNLAEYLYSGPNPFGGMSGVIYGLFGYLWVIGRLYPRFGFQLPNDIVALMLIWFFLCWFNVIPHVANMAHSGGLIGGMLAAYLHTLYLNHARKR